MEWIDLKEVDEEEWNGGKTEIQIEIWDISGRPYFRWAGVSSPVNFLRGSQSYGYSTLRLVTRQESAVGWDRNGDSSSHMEFICFTK